MSTPTSLTLPEDLRLPDLSGVRAPTQANLGRWLTVATDAADWGPNQRNGCTRRTGVELTGTWTWTNGLGKHSPDHYTPATGYRRTGAVWWQDGLLHRDHDQPARMDKAGLAWWSRGQQHRAHAPAAIYAPHGREPARHAWFWRGVFVTSPLSDLLDTAWQARALTENEVHALLDAAADPAIPHPGVDPRTWLAHVLLARPDQGIWDENTRTWLTLLAA